MRFVFTVAAALACAFVLAAPAHAQTTPNPYAPYEFLIGEWSSPNGVSQRFSWGPEQSYIQYSTRIAGQNGEDHLHFEGIMVFNAASQRLDFLFALEPGSFGQEQGEMYADADGAIVREVMLTSPNGAIGHFRQTIRTSGPNTAIAILMRETASGAWEPTFPGSDHLEMTRRG